MHCNGAAVRSDDCDSSNITCISPPTERVRRQICTEWRRSDRSPFKMCTRSTSFHERMATEGVVLRSGVRCGSRPTGSITYAPYAHPGLVTTRAHESRVTSVPFIGTAPARLQCVRGFAVLWKKALRFGCSSSERFPWQFLRADNTPLSPFLEIEMRPADVKLSL